MPVQLKRTGLALLLAGSLVGACGGSGRVHRYDKNRLQDALAKLETPGLLIGKFRLTREAVIDGDTLAVEGLRSSLRLLAIDTEETFKKEADWRLLESGWQSYLKAKQGSSKKPIKAATPLGEAAKKWAVHFFDGVDLVRLERDHPKEIRGRYGRYLAYVFAKKGGRWINYNVECVRAGMSPYFTKYSYSRRFHREFSRAQAEARAARRGIWAPGAQAYPDYEERYRWWTARADFIQRFENEAKGKPNHIVLTHWDSLRRLEEHVGKDAVVLGLVGAVRLGDRGPTRVTLSRRKGSDLPVIFFDKDVFLASRIARFRGEFVSVRGRPALYENPRTGRSELQIVVELPSQISGSETVPNYSGWPEPAAPQGTSPGGAKPDRR